MMDSYQEKINLELLLLRALHLELEKQLLNAFLMMDLLLLFTPDQLLPKGKD